jgi:hypothetical protein
MTGEGWLIGWKVDCGGCDFYSQQCLRSYSFIKNSLFLTFSFKMKSIRYELQHIIKAVEPNIGTSLIKATQGFLSRNEKTSRPTNSNEYNKVDEEGS